MGSLVVPAGPGSLAPSLLELDDGRVVLAWLQETAGGHELRYGTVGAQGVASFDVAGRAEDLFANWADRPSLHRLGDGELAAHWLRRLGEDTYAYGVELLPLDTKPSGFWLHDDTSPTEHGFVTSVAGPEETRFFWLDGRAMLEDEPMTLRTTTASSQGALPSELLDDRVCECCPTDAAWTSRGPVVVYRDRSDGEIRDISIVRRVEETWIAPRTVADDGWRIQGCPVNGPAVDASGARVAVAWFTGAQQRPRVQLALSDDFGATFSDPIVIDGERPVGRVDLQIVDDVAYVSWLGRNDDTGAVFLSAVPLGTGRPSEPRALTESKLGRSAGYPRILAVDGTLLLAWVAESSDGESASSQVRLSRFPLS